MDTPHTPAETSAPPTTPEQPTPHEPVPAATPDPVASAEPVVASVEPAPPPPRPSYPAPPALDLSRIAQDLQIRKVQVEAVLQLLDDGNTVPFITRYRKERTGGLNEDVIRRVQHRIAQMRQLGERKQTILRSIDNQGKLTDELRAAIVAADTPKRLEDLYLPFKPKKRTLATDAREKGLEALALAIWNRDPAVANLGDVLPTILNPEKGLNTVEEVVQCVGHILAEVIAETASVRGVVRMILWDTGRLTAAKSEVLPEGKGLEYKDYFQFTEPVRHIPPHRILAINRGEKENALKVKLEFDAGAVHHFAAENLPLADHPQRDLLLPIVDDALNRLLLPSLEREVRRELTERAQDHAIAVFARNLRSLLLQPPLRGKRVLAIDPGFRTGCKVAALDETGKLLENVVIHPHPPQKKAPEAKSKLEELVRRHQASIIAIGNGTACRDTEEVVAALIAELGARRRGEVFPMIAPPVEVAPPVADIPPTTVVEGTPPTVMPPLEFPVAVTFEAPLPVMMEVTFPPLPPAGEGLSIPTQSFTAGADQPGAAPPVIASATEAFPVAAIPPPVPPSEPLPEAPEDLAYVIVNEAGASDYSTSPLGREEFPNFDATLRSTISIGRRLQDPLSELVKIDPQHVGVGLYQHDVHPKHLKESLEEVIESCVNHVGVDLNTASVPLLRHISGLNQHAARELVEYRKRHGSFTNREQIKHVPGIGEIRWTQAAGFLKVPGSDEPLDSTWIHPESYPVARQLLRDLGFEPDALRRLDPDHPLRERLNGLAPEDVANRLNVGPPTVRDILDALARPGRDPRDDLPPPVFKKGILKLEDLNPGMELKGTVLNVVPFGAFVDIGLKDSGLVHISQMANRYIKSPHEVVAVGDVVTVWVLNVDAERRRASLTMIPPGTERKPPERRPPQRERGPGPAPAQGRRPGPPEGGAPRRGDRPPRGGRRPMHAPASQPGVNTPDEQAPPPPHTPRPTPERKPPKPRPLPHLSQAKREGKAYLTTLGELEAYFKAREEPPPSPPQQ